LTPSGTFCTLPSSGGAQPLRRIAESHQALAEAKAAVEAAKERSAVDAAKHQEEVSKAAAKVPPIEEERKKWEARREILEKEAQERKAASAGELQTAVNRVADVEASVEPILSEERAWLEKAAKAEQLASQAARDLEARREAVRVAEEQAAMAAYARDEAKQRAREAAEEADLVAELARRTENSRLAAVERAEACAKRELAKEREAKLAARETKKRLASYRETKLKIQLSYEQMLQTRATAGSPHCAIKELIPRFPPSPRPGKEGPHSAAVIAPKSAESSRSKSPSPRGSNWYPYAHALVSSGAELGYSKREDSKKGKKKGRRRATCQATPGVNVHLPEPEVATGAPPVPAPPPAPASLIKALAPPPLLKKSSAAGPKMKVKTAGGVTETIALPYETLSVRKDLAYKPDAKKLAIERDLQMAEWLDELEDQASMYPSDRDYSAWANAAPASSS